MSYPQNNESLQRALHCFAMVVLNLLLAIGFAVLESGYPLLHIFCAICFALLSEHHRRKHVSELQEKRVADEEYLSARRAHIRRITGK